MGDLIDLLFRISLDGHVERSPLLMQLGAKRLRLRECLAEHGSCLLLLIGRQVQALAQPLHHVVPLSFREVPHGWWLLDRWLRSCGLGH
jgi:hypothetical protein